MAVSRNSRSDGVVFLELESRGDTITVSSRYFTNLFLAFSNLNSFLLFLLLSLLFPKVFAL